MFANHVWLYMSRSRKTSKKREFRYNYASDLSFWLCSVCIIILIGFSAEIWSGMNSLKYDVYKSESMFNAMDTDEFKTVDMIDYNYMPILTFALLKNNLTDFREGQSKFDIDYIKDYVDIYLSLD